MTAPPFTCSTCVFYSPNHNNNGASGQCRRHAPTLHIYEDGGRAALWPMVRAASFCGDHAEVAQAGEPE